MNSSWNLSRHTQGHLPSSDDLFTLKSTITVTLLCLMWKMSGINDLLLVEYPANYSKTVSEACAVPNMCTCAYRNVPERLSYIIYMA